MRGRFIYIIILFILSAAELSAQVRFNKTTKKSDELIISYSNPKEYVIAKIEVEGSQFLDKNALISISGLNIGDRIKIPGSATSSAIKKLWAQGIIGDVSIYASKIEGEEVTLTILMSERPRLSRFIIEGVNKTQEKEVKDKINLVRGRVVTDALKKNAELAVRRYMEDKGYLNATIRMIEKPDTVVANSIQLRIIIDKKDKIKVNNIYVYGDTIFSDIKLKKKLKKTGERVRLTLFKDLAQNVAKLFKPKEIKSFVTTKETASIKAYINKHVKLNLFKSSKFIAEEFEEDKRTLINFYNSQGYRDAEIISDSIFAHDDKFVNIS